MPIKKANRKVGFSKSITLFAVVGMLIFAAIAFSAVAVEIETMVG